MDDPGALHPVFEHFSNAVLMKVAGKYDQILDVLTEQELQDKAVFVSNLGRQDQYVTYDLESLRGKEKNYLSLILVKREGF